MALFNDAKDVVEAWSKPDFTMSDVTAPIAVGTDLLSAVMDPVGVLLAAPLAELLTFCLQHIPLISEPLDKLLGSDSAVSKQKEAWDKVGKEFVKAGNAHADAAGDLPSWTGEASETYHRLAKQMNQIFQAVDDGCRNMGLAVQAAGTLVGMLRGFLWDMVTEVLTIVIEEAISALAAAVPTAGAALAWFAGQFTMRIGKLAMDMYKFIGKLLRRADKMTRKIKVVNDAIKKARKTVSKIVKQLMDAQKYAGRQATKSSVLPGPATDSYVPKGTVPGDTTVGEYRTRTSDGKTSADKGPFSAGNHGPLDLGEIAKEKLDKLPEKLQKKLKTNAQNAAIREATDEDVRTIE